MTLGLLVISRRSSIVLPSYRSHRARKRALSVADGD